MVSVPDPTFPSSDCFSSGPLCQLSPLNGWDSPTLSQPGESTQSWLRCPLISLGLLAVETRLSVRPFSTGPRAPVPEEQVQFWTHQKPDIIVALAVHFLPSPIMTFSLLRCLRLSVGSLWKSLGGFFARRIDSTPHVVSDGSVAFFPGCDFSW